MTARTTNNATTSELDRIAALAAAAWGEREIGGYVSEAVRSPGLGSLTDWGLGVRPPASDLSPISLGGGIPDAETQPRAQLLAAMERVLAAPGDAALVYGGAFGFEPLREEIARFFAPDHPGRPNADWYLLTNGAAGAIEAVCTGMVDPGDAVIAEIPTFAGSLRTIRGKRADVVGVPMDDEGIRLDRLEATIDRLESVGRRVKLIYTQPTFQNPTGLTATLERRIGLIELASRRGVFILEDHAYSELYFDAPPPPTLSELSGGHGVFTVGTFSKVIATGLRVGWVQARPEWIQALLPARFDMGNSPLLHRMLHEYMVRGDFPEHVERMRVLYARKAAALGAALSNFGEPYFELTLPQGGFFLWLRLHNGIEAADLYRGAQEQAVFFAPGDRFYPNGDRAGAPQSLRLAYSWPPTAKLEEAAERLRGVFHSVAG